MLQKAMEQGRNVHGIPSHDACSDFTTSTACLLHFFSKWLLVWHRDLVSKFTYFDVRGWDNSVQQNMLASWRLIATIFLFSSTCTIHLVSPNQHTQ